MCCQYSCNKAVQYPQTHHFLRCPIDRKVLALISAADSQGVMLGGRK